MPRIEDYDYFLPPELVAQYPLGERDASRLLVLHRARGEIRHAGFRELAAVLDENDVLVVNDTRVFPARLNGRKDSGGKVELLLHHLPQAEGNGGVPPAARARATHRGHLKIGQVLNFGADVTAAVLALPEPGVAEVRFTAAGGDPVAAVLAAGQVPLPPYIQRPGRGDRDRETYQTSVRPRQTGAVACPHRGLHFTRAVVGDLEPTGASRSSPSPCMWGPGRSCRCAIRTIPGIGCCRSISSLPRGRPAARLNDAKARGRTNGGGGHHQHPGLESLRLAPGFCGEPGLVRSFIYPGTIQGGETGLLTNFHLPHSTLLFW